MTMKESHSWKQEDWSLHRFSLVAEPRDGVPKKGCDVGDILSIGCQADGCDVNLDDFNRKYYTRYRVCPTHQKAMCSIVGGEKKRFCQQCGKFHSLSEFDGNKKSCIARLEMHNVRRKRLREIQHMLKSRGYVDREAMRKKYNLTDRKLAMMEAKAKSKLGMSQRDGSSVDSVLHCSKESDVSTSTEKDTQSRKPASEKGVESVQSYCEEMSSSEIKMPMDRDLNLLQDSYLDPMLSSEEQQSDMNAELLYLSDDRNSWDLDELRGSAEEHQNNHESSCIKPDCADLCQEMLTSVDNPLSHPEWDQQLFGVACKLDNITPADLTSGVGPGLGVLCGSDTIEGYMRPGCVYLQADAFGKNSTCVDVRAKAEQFLRTVAAKDGSPIAEKSILQIDEHLVYTDGNSIRQIFSLKNARNLLPALRAVSSLGIVAQEEPVEIALESRRVHNSDRVFVRSGGEHLEAHIMSIEATENDQSLFVSIFGCVNPGVLQIELNRGAYTSKSQLVVVCTTAEEAHEVQRFDECHPPCLRTILYNVGMVMEAKHRLDSGLSHGDVAAEYKSAPKPPSESAQELIPVLIQKKMHHILACTLEACLCSNEKNHVILSSIEQHCLDSTGMTLLQYAVKSQSVQILQCILLWGQTHGLPLESCREGRGKTTALHLAAMVKDEGNSAELLTQYCIDAIDGWEGAKAMDGTSPIALATVVGNAEDIEKRISVGAQKNECISARDKSRLCKKTWFRTTRSEDTLVDKEKEGNKMGALLEFSSQYLEDEYKVWFHRRWMMTDFTVLAMTMLYQGLALYKREYNTSITAYISAIVLFVYSTAVVGSSFFSQEMYVRHREWLCVGFVLLHTVLHVTTHGLVDMSSLSPLSALFHGGSLLQVIMLTVGLRPRFKALVICLATMLPMSALLNPSMCSAAFESLSASACVSSLLVYQLILCLIVPSYIVYKTELSTRNSFVVTKSTSKKFK